MAVFDFPASPTLNQTYTFGGKTWTYNGTGWVLSNTSGFAGLTLNSGGSGAASGTTFNGTAAVTLSYNTIGAAGLSAANAFTNNNSIDVGGGTNNSTAPLSIWNGGGNWGFMVVPRSGAGGWNPLVQAGDSTIISRAGAASDAGALFVGVWSSTNTGIRLTSTTATITASSGITMSNNTTFNASLYRSIAGSIATAGSTQATATALTKDINVITTNTASTQGVALPAAVAGMEVIVINTTSTSFNVYPVNGGTAGIDALGTNAAFTLAANSRIMFIATGSTQWYTLNATYA